MNEYLALLGDVSLNGLISETASKNNSRFNAIRKRLRSIDIVVANLESPVKVSDTINAEKLSSKGVINIADKNVVESVLPFLNLKGASLANNHIYDQCESGIKTTIDLLKKLGIEYTGAEYTKEKAIQPIFFDLGINRIAFLAYVHLQTNPMFPNNMKSNVNVFDEKKVLNDIKKIKNKVDYIILSLHWGHDYSCYPTSSQTNSAKKFIDAGVKIIMGHHPHVVQPYEHYDNGWIFYSLGQLCYGDFIWDGKLGSLKRKTKKAAFPVFDEDLNLIEFITTKELKGNYIKLTNWDYERWSKIHLNIANIMMKYGFVKTLMSFKEAVIDRLYEYFFGYYRNPFKQLFQIDVNFKKIRYLKRDFKKYSNDD